MASIYQAAYRSWEALELLVAVMMADQLKQLYPVVLSFALHALWLDELFSRQSPL